MSEKASKKEATGTHRELIISPGDEKRDKKYEFAGVDW